MIAQPVDVDLDRAPGGRAAAAVGVDHRGEMIAYGLGLRAADQRPPPPGTPQTDDNTVRAVVLGGRAAAPWRTGISGNWDGRAVGAVFVWRGPPAVWAASGRGQGAGPPGTGAPPKPYAIISPR